jgi:hypothetical protein
MRPKLNFFTNAPTRGDALIRACTASLLSTASGLHEVAHKIAAREWGKESDPAILLRAAVSPASTSNTATDMFVQAAVSDFLSTMGAVSAAPVLQQRGLQLSLGEFGAINVPSYTVAAGSSAFVGEGSPIPARQLVLDGISLTPKKFASIISFTHETLTGSMPNIVSVVGTVLTESVGLDYDTAFFDTSGATATRPAGLRAGITVTAHEATLTSIDAMVADLATLAAAVAPVAGNGAIVFVAAPRQAAAIKIRAPQFPHEVLSSSSLTAGTVICVATAALVSAINPTPVIESSIAATIHENTTPLPLVDGSAAAGTRSLWQTDSLALRLVLEVSWGLRSASGLAWTSSVTW